MAVSLRDPNPVQLVVGTQWGDEGKGKVVDLLSENVDLVARFQGGPNAGHTVQFDGKTFILHHIPTGILRPDIQCIIGNGVVVNPTSLLEEIDELEQNGIDVSSRLYFSCNAHLIMPYHPLLDQAAESMARGEKIGTTGRGIGPAYADKISRTGIRLGELLDFPSLRETVSENVRVNNHILEKVYNTQGVELDSVLSILQRLTDRIRPMIVDTRQLLLKNLTQGRRLLIEGAQGTLLDIDFGTYPFVTSSNTTAGGVFTGLGLGFRQIDRVIGIVKAYTTRVGDGPFPTELTGSQGEHLRKLGAEFGATTGRPRRCGWFDAVVAKYAIQINCVDSLAITKLDVLDSFDSIDLCTGYRYRGELLGSFPADPRILNEIELVYETMPGWKAPITGIRSFDALPENAIRYLRRLEALLEAPIGLVSVGSNRNDTIWL